MAFVVGPYEVRVQRAGDMDLWGDEGVLVDGRFVYFEALRYIWESLSERDQTKIMASSMKRVKFKLGGSWYYDPSTYQDPTLPFEI